MTYDYMIESIKKRLKSLSPEYQEKAGEEILHIINKYSSREYYDKKEQECKHEDRHICTEWTKHSLFDPRTGNTHYYWDTYCIRCKNYVSVNVDPSTLEKITFERTR